MCIRDSVDPGFAEDAQQAAGGGRVNGGAHLGLGDPPGGGDPGRLILRCGGGDVRVQSAAGAGDQIHGNGRAAHGGIGGPEGGHALSHQGPVLRAGRTEVGGPGVHDTFAVPVGKGVDVNIHNAAPEVLRAGELLAQKLGAIGPVSYTHLDVYKRQPPVRPEYRS